MKAYVSLNQLVYKGPLLPDLLPNFRLAWLTTSLHESMGGNMLFVALNIPYAIMVYAIMPLYAIMPP